MTNARDTALQLFSPPVAGWFRDRFGAPTDVQARAWPRIAAGEHVLLTAPTGSGKTLAAFLWALDRLLTGAWECGATRVVYVSPLKALGNDIQRNLTEPLAELSRLIPADGGAEPAVRVASRTGDTPQEERRRMLRSPPEILITTPETLNILLTSVNGRRLLTALRCVILDEIHAVASSKRGVHLMTAVERLVPLSGEFQRVALSATVRPLERVARWVGGFEPGRSPDQAELVRRPVAVVAGDDEKRTRLRVSLPSATGPSESREPDAFWSAFGRDLWTSIARNRSTLVFANARRTVEKVTRFVNEAAPDRIAYSHHGALSREIRSVVEQRLKAGELKAIVATSSLELGIDIGAIDEVIMVQTPPSVASTLQRLGRSGHAVGATSAGRLLPFLGRDLLEAAVVARCVLDGEIEEIRPVDGPLDVLAQVLLSMIIEQPRRIDELYRAIRCAEPYRNLSRPRFDGILEMLAGRDASSRVRSLRPMISIDAIDKTVRARRGVERLIYLSGGTIPDRGYYRLRVADSGALLGELDEEFVWERSVGDTFTLGVQTWRVERITHNDVIVAPAQARSAMAPFWRADELDRSSFVSIRMARLLEAVEGRLDDKALPGELAASHALDDDAAAALVEHLRQQRAATGCLPHRRRLVIEHTASPAGRSRHRQTVIHTLWGGRVNRPFAAALGAAWADRWGAAPEIAHNADCVVIVHPAGIELDDPFDLVPVAELEALLHRAVGRSAFFGARFREAAGRALLLPRGTPGKRVPLWVQRQRAKELLEAVRSSADFPVTLEAWRSCLQDSFELEVLRQRLDEVADGRVAVRHVTTETPSPFTAQVAWQQTNRLMYADDAPSATTATGADLVRELALASHLRPRVAPELAADLQRRLHRVELGWSPRDAHELEDWVRERIAIPEAEWSELLDAMARDHGTDAEEVSQKVAHRVVLVDPPEAGGTALAVSVELLSRLEGACGRAIPDDRLRSPSDAVGPDAAIEARRRVPGGSIDADLDVELTWLVGEWLRFYSAVEPTWIAAALGVPDDRLDAVVRDLEAADTVVVDAILDGATRPQVSDRLNLERLLRMARSETRPSLEPIPARRLPLLLAEHQNLGLFEVVPEDLQHAVERLLGLPLPAGLWETEILPARLDPYLPGWLDALIGESDLRWVGAGEGRLFLALDGELDLLPRPDDSAAGSGGRMDLLPHPSGRFTFDELVRASGMDSAEMSRRLWRSAWRGEVSSDSFAAVRDGIAGGFETGPPVESAPMPRRGGRVRFRQWRRSRPFAGTWFALPAPTPPDDVIARDDRDRDRARIVLDRYGLVFRELLGRELPELRWGAIFRALRLLELGGEIVAGHFVDGVVGLQFATHATVNRLRDGLDSDRVWWLCAADPASPCSIGLEIDDWELPHRLPGNHLVFHGEDLVVVSRRRGAELTIGVGSDHPELARYLAFLGSLVSRVERPRKRVDIESVNGEPATSSPYRSAIAERFQVTRQPTALRIARKY